MESTRERDGVRGSLPKLQQAHLARRAYMTNIVSTTKTLETAYLKHTSNAPFDVPIVMPEHADGSSESKETEDAAEVELDDCQCTQTSFRTPIIVVWCVLVSKVHLAELCRRILIGNYVIYSCSPRKTFVSNIQ